MKLLKPRHHPPFFSSRQADRNFWTSGSSCSRILAVGSTTFNGPWMDAKDPKTFVVLKADQPVEFGFANMTELPVTAKDVIMWWNCFKMQRAKRFCECINIINFRMIQNDCSQNRSEIGMILKTRIIGWSDQICSPLGASHQKKVEVPTFKVVKRKMKDWKTVFLIPPMVSDKVYQFLIEE